MILVDTSVWIEHLRARNAALEWYLQQGEVLMHPVVLGELACSNLRNRAELLSLLQRLPRCRGASDVEALYFIERRQLMGKGIGWVDAHLLASVALGGTQGLWTRDQRLQKVAEELGLAAQILHPQGNLHDAAPR
jgi:predicted nucleic acid-binding protein